MIETGNPFDDIMRTIRGEGGGVTPPVPAASPTYPTAAPSVATTPPKSGGLTALLPVIAALIAAKRGGLPGYAGGMVDAQKSRQDLALKQGAAQRDQQQIDIARQRAEAETARYADEAQKEQLARQAAAKKFLEERVNRAFDNNPQLEDQVNTLGADKFSIPGPDGSNINLEQALGAIGAVQGPDGKYTGLGKPATRTPLVTGTGPTGKPQRVEDKPGVVPYERPRVPPQSTNRAYTWKDDDPESETFGKSFRVVEDAQGNVVKKTPLTGTTPATPPAKATPKTTYQVGQSVTLKNGSKVTIKQINPDGTFDY